MLVVMPDIISIFTLIGLTVNIQNKTQNHYLVLIFGCSKIKKKTPLKT